MSEPPHAGVGGMRPCPVLVPQLTCPGGSSDRDNFSPSHLQKSLHGRRASLLGWGRGCPCWGLLRGLHPERSEPVRGRCWSREKEALLCSSFPHLGDGLGSTPPAPRRRGQFAYVWKDRIPEWPAPEALAKCPSGCSPLPAVPDVSPTPSRRLETGVLARPSLIPPPPVVLLEIGNSLGNPWI